MPSAKGLDTCPVAHRSGDNLIILVNPPPRQDRPSLGLACASSGRRSATSAHHPVLPSRRNILG